MYKCSIKVRNIYTDSYNYDVSFWHRGARWAQDMIGMYSCTICLGDKRTEICLWPGTICRQELFHHGDPNTNTEYAFLKEKICHCVSLRILDYHIQISFNSRCEIIPQTPAWAYIWICFYFSIYLYFENWLRKKDHVCTFIQDLMFFILNSCFFNTKLQSFKQLFFVIFIIAGDFYLRTCPIVNFEWK